MNNHPVFRNARAAARAAARAHARAETRQREEITTVSQLDATFALADAQPVCIVGNEPFTRDRGHPSCGKLAVWAVRVHDGMGDAPTGHCPAVILVCDSHLDQMRRDSAANLSRAGRRGATIKCGTCNKATKTVDDVLWGVERIRP